MRTLVFLLVLTSPALAQDQSPMTCSVAQQDLNCHGNEEWYRTGCQPVYFPVITCFVTRDAVHLEGITLNRSRCDLPKMASEAVGKTYHFRYKIVIMAGACNLLEYTMQIDGRGWTLENHD